MVGYNPPFHTPLFVLTRHPRPSVQMNGGTTFHFLDVSPAEALEERFQIESVSSPSGVTHVVLSRT